MLTTIILIFGLRKDKNNQITSTNPYNESIQILNFQSSSKRPTFNNLNRGQDHVQFCAYDVTNCS